MAAGSRLLGAGSLLLLATHVRACEPVLPFVQTVAPTVALSGSLMMLAGAVFVKSALFAVFERRLPFARAVWRMFLGNILTSFVGMLVAVMIGSGPALWFVGIPLVCLLCWLPSRRLVQVAPLKWLSQFSGLGVAGFMTVALFASCILFVISRGAIENHELARYWTVKVIAIFMALFASVTLTTIWEEWAIWRLSSRPVGTRYFTTVLRANLYVMVLVLAIPAVLILPKRLKSPDFLAKHKPAIAQVSAWLSEGVK